MAGRSAQSRVELFRGVPLDRQGQHTIWFYQQDEPIAGGKANRIRQINFFKEHWGVKSYSEYSFQKVTDGVVQVTAPFEDLDDINYIAMSNVDPVDGSERWHYAFVDSVHYISFRCQEIHYTLDPLQCYQEWVRFGECLIERSHISKSLDKPGYNLVADSIPFGEYVYGNAVYDSVIPEPKYEETEYNNPESPEAKTAKINGWSFVAAQVDTAVHPYNFEGTPIKLNTFETYVELNDFLDKINKEGKTEEVIAMYMCPNIWLQDNTIFGSGKGETAMKRDGVYPRPSTVDGYTPTNKKLLTFPYCFLTITNNAGNYLKYKYEDSYDSDNVHYSIYGTCLPGSKPVLAPTYPGELRDRAFGLGLQLPPLPNIPVPSDSYQIWLAQNQGSNEIANLATANRIINNLVGVGSNATSLANQAAEAGLAAGKIPLGVANAGAAILDSYTAIRSNQARYTDAAAMPDHISGLSSPELQYGTGNYRFTIMPTSIRAEVAKTIDAYWTRYGYPRMEIDRPNPQVRKRYYYVKSSDANVYSNLNTGSFGEAYGLPQWCIDGWKSSLARGLTFWRYNQIFDSNSNVTMFSYGGN